MLNIVRYKTVVPLLLSMLLLVATGCTQKQVKQTQQATTKPRIISLAPSLTEMIFAIGAGDQLVGRTSACDWPAEAEKVPIVGAFGRPSLELLASINPDIVVDVDLAEEETGKKIVALGIKRETVPCTSPDDVPAVLRKLGQLTGHTREADSLALTISNGLANFKSQGEKIANRKKVYLEIWDDPFWTGGKGSYTSALIAYAGGQNIGDAVEKEYFEISQEWVIQQNPDVIACMYMARSASVADQVKSRPGWNTIAAVKNNHVYDNFENSLFLRPGPRVLEGIAQMQKLLQRQ